MSRRRWHHLSTAGKRTHGTPPRCRFSAARWLFSDCVPLPQLLGTHRQTSLAEGRASALRCVQTAMTSATSCGQSSGTTGSRIVPRCGVSCTGDPEAAELRLIDRWWSRP